jgi:REP element-mobilizing transposase RayT
MGRRFSKSSRSSAEHHGDKHRFEHWYLDNQVYFITARCREQFSAFESEEAKAVFWDRFEHYCKELQFEPWVTSLLDNHYHNLGYVRVGSNLKLFMQRLHGSVAKLVNDLLPERRVTFWRDERGKEYFDGCIRDENQLRPAYRYTREQARRHGIMHDYALYPHTRIYVPLELALKRAQELGAYLESVPYKRYQC